MLELVCSRLINRCCLQPYIVLKCKATDDETIAFEKTVCDSQFARGGCTPHHSGPSIGGGPKVGQVAEGARGRMGKNLHSGLRGKEWARQGKLV